MFDADETLPAGASGPVDHPHIQGFDSNHPGMVGCGRFLVQPWIDKDTLVTLVL